jgi:hypothetical protein
MDKIANEGYTMIFDDIKLVEDGSPYSFPLTVGESDYEIWGIGGLRISDLDVRIYDSNYDLVDEDNQTDNYPVVAFSAYESTRYTVEVEGYEFEPGFSEGYFLVIVVKD